MSNSQIDITKWKNGFFDCCSPGRLCLMTTCFPCITYSKTQYALTRGSLKGYSCCNSSVRICNWFRIRRYISELWPQCIVFALASHFGLQFIPAMMQRKQIREKFNLEGSCLGDFCRSGACTCCVLMQNGKESEQRMPLVVTPYPLSALMVYPQVN